MLLEFKDKDWIPASACDDARPTSEYNTGAMRSIQSKMKCVCWPLSQKDFCSE